eukprot:CAMPEP_0183707244 /NCGR_PEP_ID=MMETSP0737-20130205/3858_1 /TAXON_ID=385413 /ORGANISM="Thalassiosira miniscula, Strain CCMP1093" /LENGTH=217 /DNA_ID=CAMNT_0025934855 /DNA_START=91 /DNA_END=744 /DNA_ORIENTATION=-
MATKPNQLGPSLQITPTCHLHAIAGSLVTDFVGDAMVNAANEGCVSGFGIDEAINKAGGYELIRSRRELGGCPTGQAKITPSFGLERRVKFIVHAVGPVYRNNRRFLPFSGVGTSANDEHGWDEKDTLLTSAYREALQRAAEADCRTVGFCLLSAGVFRGERPLEDIVGMAIEALVGAPEDVVKDLESVCLFAYMAEERGVMERIMVQRSEGLQERE